MYAWKITKDNVSDGDDSDVGVKNYHGCDETVVFSHRFRMLDDDGEIYYYGRYYGPLDETMFRPLDDFGMPNAGCTEIQYYNPKTSAYETL